MDTIRSVTASLGFAIVLDGRGGIRATLDVAGPPWPQVPEPSLIVVNGEDARAAAWLADNVALDAADRGALLGPIRRTWAAAFDVEDERVAILVLEAIPHTRGSMAQASGTRTIVSQGRLIVLGDLTQPTPMFDRVREVLRIGKGARSPAEALIELTRLWTDHYMSEALDLDRATATLEDHSFSGSGRADVNALNQIRRRTALLRRRAASHRAAIAAVGGLEGTALIDGHGDRWGGLMRQSEDLIDLLDGVIEREHAVDDHLQNQFSTELNDRLYLLTLVSAILLPLSFVTGLLGVNINGIPLRESRWAFWLLCSFLVALAIAQYWLVKKLRWLPKLDARLKRGESR